ncbi:hypothetical protein [Streptomyces sp. NPDC058644]|uniref:hypothetical protein n=1 Tax=unclassified Streptomyces TaxID=2593676 RepID=UPI00364B84FA
MGIFLGALTGLGLLYELEAYVEADEDEYGGVEVAQAASVLGVGAGAGTGGEEDEEDWEAVREARHVRDAVFSSWLDALTSLDRVHQTLRLFPWLVEWASARVELKTRRCEELREQAAQLVDVQALVLAAAVSAMERPALPSGDPAFAPLGSADAVESALQKLWERWQGTVGRDWDHPRESGYMAHYVADGMGRRRKGRDELLERCGRLLGEWSAGGQAVVAEARGERVLVTQALPEGWSQHRERGSFFDRVSEWERGVLAAFAVSVDWDQWGQLAVRVRVPEVVAARLLSGQGAGLSYAEEGAAQVVMPRSGEGVVPGVFDDTPVGERRLVTGEHLRALRSTVREAEQLYVVAGLGGGVEVVALSVLEERCAGGWRGIILAAASDLPQELFADREQATVSEGPVWASPVHDPGAEGFGWSLGMAEGERVVVRLCEGRRDVGQALRALTLARSVVDLRELAPRGREESGRPRYPFGSAVWHGLLAMEQLDLEPFEGPEGDWPGSDLPLGVLASVQAYTTDGAGRYQGRAHSPECAHRRPQYGVDRDDELVTIARLLGSEKFDPCSKCGGYAVRRLTGDQVAYYRAAHRLHALSVSDPVARGRRRPAGRRGQAPRGAQGVR